MDYAKNCDGDRPHYLIMVFTGMELATRLHLIFGSLLWAPTRPVYALTGENEMSLVAVAAGCQNFGGNQKQGYMAKDLFK